MNTLMNSTGSVFGGDLQARSTVTGDSHVRTGDIFTPRGQGDISQASLFSRLLSGKLAGSRRDDIGTDRPPVQYEPRCGQVDSDSETNDQVNARSDTSSATDQAAGAVDSVGAFQPWAGLTGMLQVAELAGFGQGMIPDFTVSGGIPAELRSRLSAEIAANFSDRNGTQQITFKFKAGHLGQIDVRLQAKAEHLTIRLLVATRESEATLRENINDLAKEFTDLIVAQRAFQANSRVITTADQVLQELVNLVG